MVSSSTSIDNSYSIVGTGKGCDVFKYRKWILLYIPTINDKAIIVLYKKNLVQSLNIPLINLISSN